VQRADNVTGLVIKRLDVSRVLPEDAFLRVVREPLEGLFRVHPDQHVVLLVDAVDESMRYSGPVGIAALLTQAEYLPVGVRLIVTCREGFEDVLRPMLSQGQECSLSKAEGLIYSKEDVRRHVIRVLDASTMMTSRLDAELSGTAFADSLQTKSRGNFLYLRYLLQMLGASQAKITQQSLEALPNGLNGIYLEFLGRLVRKEIWPAQHAPILGTLCVAREGLNENQIAMFVAKPASQVRWFLNELRQFLDSDDELLPSNRTYSLYHFSFADFLQNKDLAAEYWCSASENHGRIADYYLNRFAENWHNSDTFGLRHFIFHLVKSSEKRLDGAASAFSPGFLRAKIDRFGTERSVLDDLVILISAARSALDLVGLLRWCWLHVGLRDRLSHAVNAESLPFYVMLGQTEKAIDMIEALDEDSLHAFGERDTARQQVACALAERGQIDQALTLVRAIAKVSERNVALCELAYRVARHDPARAIEIAREGGFVSALPDLCRMLAQKESYFGPDPFDCQKLGAGFGGRQP